MAKWLDKYEQGGLVLKQKTKDNYGKKPNPNDVTVSSGPNYVGMGNDITGRDYSPAWGGQFQSGGFLEPISYKLPSRYRIPYAEPSTELATSIGGEKGEPAYLIPTFKGGKDLKDPVAEYRKTGEHLGGPFKTWQEAEKWEQEIRHPYVEKGKPIPTPLKRWGDMEDGGYVAQKGKSVPTMADSLALYNNSNKVLNYYKDKKYQSLSSGERYGKKNYYKEKNKETLEEFIRRNKMGTISVPKGKGSETTSIPVDSYYKKFDDNRYFQREGANAILDTRAPMQLFDDRITPTMLNFYRNIDKNDPLTDDYVSIFSYDPILVKPVSMLTPEERATRLKRYGKESGLIDKNIKLSTSTEKSKTEPEKKKTPIIKKSEETKPAPYTPTGSKKYIVNGMEVSEEDFLGSGATTGGGKRVIYNTPNKGKQQVLRLDGTPETDPDKIRRALATAQKDNMAMGGSLPGAVGFTYARVAGSAPANGKYTKKTKASAQNGKEMKFYQDGLDFKPNSIAQDGAIVDPMGQWAHPGEVTIIPATNITMEGVDYPVLGISDTGDQQMMYPGEDYNFDGEYVTEYPMMQKGGWLSKYQEKAPSDATRVSAPVKPLTKKEQKENIRINKQTQKNTEELNKAIVAERKSKRETKGDVNVPGSFNITEKFRLFPKSVGGIGEVIDEYVNPGTFVGRLADSLGESVAARSPEGVATTLAMTAGAGALGFDPLGSALKSKTLRTAIEESNGIARTIRDIPRAENVKEAIGRIGGIPLKKDIPRMAAEDVKALRQVQEIGRLRATNSPLANQMKYGLETNLPEEHFQKVFGKSREEAQKLLNSGFGEQEAAKSANIRSRIDLRRNRGSDLDADRLNALGENNVVNPRQTVDRNEVLDELLQRATQPISESRYRSLSSDEILNNFNRSYTTETKMTGSMKNFDRKLNSLIYKNIQDYPYYSGEVLQKVPSLNLSGSGNLKEVSKKVNFAPEGISSGDVFTGSTNTSHSSWLPQIKQVFKYDKGTPQFLGYQPMNSLGFLSGYGYDEKDIAKYLNSEIDEQIKRGVIPKNISRPFQKGEHVMLPHYGIKQNKNGGWLTKYK